MADLSGGRELLHTGRRGRRAAKFRPAVHERDARLVREIDRPVERGIAATEDRELLAVKVRRALHAIVKMASFDRIRAIDREAPRLERTETAGDDDRAGIEARAGRGDDVEAVVRALRDAQHFLAEMELRIEGLDLLHEPVDEFLGAADRDRGNVIDRL